MPDLKEELKSVMQDKTPVSRADPRVAHRFLAAHPAIAVLMGIVMLAAAWASIEGLLRWQLPLPRYSFAALALLGAVYCFMRAFRRSGGGVN